MLLINGHFFYRAPNRERERERGRQGQIWRETYIKIDKDKERQLHKSIGVIIYAILMNFKADVDP